METDRTQILEIFINGQVDSVAEVRVHTGQGKQIRGANKEVTMESMKTQPCTYGSTSETLGTPFLSNTKQHPS